MEQGVPVEFTLLGRGPFEAELRKVAKEVGIHDRIRWISQMPQQELFALYRTMHCFLFPSLHDSSGNVVLEAQANGLPRCTTTPWAWSMANQPTITACSPMPC